MNYMHGERYGYARVVLEHLLDSRMLIPDGSEKLRFWYDVGCKFKTYWERYHPDLTTKVDHVIPAMHAKAHNAACRSKHSGLVTKGACEPNRYEHNLTITDTTNLKHHRPPYFGTVSSTNKFGEW